MADVESSHGENGALDNHHSDSASAPLAKKSKQDTAAAPKTINRDQPKEQDEEDPDSESFLEAVAEHAKEIGLQVLGESEDSAESDMSDGGSKNSGGDPKERRLTAEEVDDKWQRILSKISEAEDEMDELAEEYTDEIPDWIYEEIDEHRLWFGDKVHGF